MRVNRLFWLLISLVSCQTTQMDLTIQDIEIFEGTPAWDLAKALDENNIEVTKQILSNDASLVDYQEPKFGITLLIRAALTENYTAVCYLLENNANPNIIAGIGGTALFYAVSHSWHDAKANENPKFMKKLLEYGADPNITFCAPETIGETSPTECGTSPLMHATQRGIQKVKLLVEGGADIDYKTELGKTAAIKALLHKKIDVAHYLIVENKAKVTDPYYFYELGTTRINSQISHLPIKLLEDWLFEIGSIEHKIKMEIVKEFSRQGQDYWRLEKHPKTIERIKRLYPETWQVYLDNY